MKNKFTLTNLGSYLLRGTFIAAPVFFTIIAIWEILNILDSPVQNIFYSIFGFRVYGLGLATLFVILIFIGYLGSTILMNKVFKGIEFMIFKIPLVKELYKSIRDIIGAFVSDKKKFEKPVLVEVNQGIFRIGFVTNETLSNFDILEEVVAVYFPLSYAFTGELLIVKKDKLKHLDPSDVGHLMKFIISGGIVHQEELPKKSLTN